MAGAEDIQNRRRQERQSLQANCEIIPKSPAWTLLPDPLPGRTVNVTEHGIRIVLPRFLATRFEKWRQHLERGETISVLIRLDPDGEPLEVNGQLVWTQFEKKSERSGDCSVGILLALLDAETRRRLAETVERLGS